jgi:hypothetical protein
MAHLVLCVTDNCNTDNPKAPHKIHTERAGRDQLQSFRIQGCCHGIQSFQIDMVGKPVQNQNLWVVCKDCGKTCISSSKLSNLTECMRSTQTKVAEVLAEISGSVSDDSGRGFPDASFSSA